MSEKTTRCRGINFSSYEKDLIIELVSKYRSIIECRKADGLNLKEKEAAWEKINQAFNSSAHVSPRTTKQLKQVYVNLRRNTKKGKRGRSSIGGGECKQRNVDESALLSIEGHADPHDSFPVYYEEVPAEQRDAGEVLRIIQEDDDTEVKLEPTEAAVLFLGEAVTEASGEDSRSGARIVQQSSPTRKESSQLARSRIATVCEQEVLLMQKKYHAELELIELKKETQKLKQQVLKAKLAKLK